MLETTKLWFDKAVKNPTNKNLHVQIGCHLEEVAEMLASITVKPMAESGLCPTTQLQTVHQAVDMLATAFKTGQVSITNIDIKELLDSLADQIVTGVGVGHMLHLNVPKALELVNESNWSKFVDGEPIFDANGKIAKGPNFHKPDLTELSEQVLPPSI